MNVSTEKLFNCTENDVSSDVVDLHADKSGYVPITGDKYETRDTQTEVDSKNNCVHQNPDFLLQIEEDSNSEELPSHHQQETDNGSDFNIAVYLDYKRCWKTRYCHICTYVLLIAIVLLAVVMFSIVWIMIVIPFIKVYNFRQTSCVVIGSSQSMIKGPCSCLKLCDKNYPCLKIQVQFIDHNNRYKNTTIWDNEILLDKQCSFYPTCRTSTVQKVKKVDDYRLLYGSTTTRYDCYVSKTENKAIRVHHFQVYHVAHGIFWTTLILLLSIFFLGLHIKKQKSKCESLS